MPRLAWPAADTAAFVRHRVEMVMFDRHCILAVGLWRRARPCPCATVALTRRLSENVPCEPSHTCPSRSDRYFGREGGPNGKSGPHSRPSGRSGAMAIIERAQSDPTAWWWYYGQTAEQVGQLLQQNNARLVDICVQSVSASGLIFSV